MKNIKIFLLGGVVALLLALVVVIAVFMYLQITLKQVTQIESDSTAATEVSPLSNDVSPAKSPEIVSETNIPEDGIPLNSLPLSDAQKSSFETFGIDVETFVITPDMVVCAEGKLGPVRVQAIIDGSSVTVLEGIALASCLR